MDVPFAVNPKIVRGLDYYTRTVFELITHTKDGNLTVCGGGRYDHLVQELGGPDIPAVGFGMGIERVLMLLQQEGIELPQPRLYDVFVTYMGENRLHAFRLVQALREAGIRADMDHCARSLKAQFKFANKQHAAICATIGDDEAAASSARLKFMAEGQEETVAWKDCPERIRAYLNTITE